MRRKLLLAIFLCAALLMAACHTERKVEDIYYAPFQPEDAAYVNDTVYFLLNQVLYKFNKEQLCLERACPYAPKDCHGSEKDGETTLCPAGDFVPGTLLGNQGNELLAVNNELFFEINKIDSVSLKQTMLAEINAKSSYMDYPCFGNDYCYYAVNPTISANSEVKICKVPLYESITREDHYEAEIVWKSGRPADRNSFKICQLDVYDPYVIFTVLSSEYAQAVYKLYVYNESTDVMVINGLKDVTYAGYNNGCVVYLDDAGEQVKMTDIETSENVALFPLETYEKGSTLACDSDYIYINYQAAYSEALGTGDALAAKDDYMVIDIYDYDGRLLTTVDMSESTKYELCSRYLCSTDKYIFIGEASNPWSRGLYVIEKEDVEIGGQPGITELYVRDM